MISMPKIGVITHCRTSACVMGGSARGGDFTGMLTPSVDPEAAARSRAAVGCTWAPRLLGSGRNGGGVFLVVDSGGDDLGADGRDVPLLVGGCGAPL